MTNTPRNEMKMLTLLSICIMSFLVNVMLLLSIHYHKKDNAALIERNTLLRMHSTPFSDEFVEVGMEFPSLSLSEQLVLAQYRLEHGRVNQ
jgi:hypothetical protein